PDLATAQRLVHQSGTYGARVTLMAPAPQTAGFRPIIEALRSVGYDARFHPYVGTNYFDALVPAFASGAANGGFAGWLADYPAASNFVQTQVPCAQRPKLGGSNFALYCNPALDRRINAAAKKQQSDPAAATTVWSAIDRAVTDAAPYIPLVNPVRIDIVSSRLRNVVRNPILGALYDQAWLR
ncbi:MAG: hypothetical protein ACTHK4_04825, partial [Mycobacteriales bacterium]